MSGEVIAVIAVGITLAGLILTGNARIEARLGALEAIVGDLRERATALEVRVANIEATLGLPSRVSRAGSGQSDGA